LPSIVALKYCNYHPLILSPPPKDGTDEYYREVCETERRPDLWIYYCAPCEYEDHVSCICPDVPPCLPEALSPGNVEFLKDVPLSCEGLVFDHIFLYMVCLEDKWQKVDPQLREISDSKLAWLPEDGDI